MACTRNYDSSPILALEVRLSMSPPATNYDTTAFIAHRDARTRTLRCKKNSTGGRWPQERVDAFLDSPQHKHDTGEIDGEAH